MTSGVMITALLLLLKPPRSLSSSQSGHDRFKWGVATSALQIEGCLSCENRQASIWDQYNNGENSDSPARADNSYVQYKDDVRLIKNMGLNAYRFSISWSRIITVVNSTRSKVNIEGVKHYNDLINELISNDIEPYVTLYHWDMPLYYELNYNSWLEPVAIIKDFRAYADVCFNAFGDRVKMWFTINEPWTFTVMGYIVGAWPPMRCSNRHSCTQGDSSVEGYRVAHNILLAHSEVVELFREKYQSRQGGQIGMVLNHDFAEPLDPSSSADVAAAERRNVFAMGWFADPLVFGDYPPLMRETLGNRLPYFTRRQSLKLKGSYDFLAINHYSSKYYSVRNSSETVDETKIANQWAHDQNNSESKVGRDGSLIGAQADSPWLNVYPLGFYKMLRWSSDRYTVAGRKPAIFVTENGCDVPDEGDLPFDQMLNDTFRIDYYKGYLSELLRAIADGVDVRGYFAWSLLDNYEWKDGYTKHFGLHFADYRGGGRDRAPKASAGWYAAFAKEHRWLNSDAGAAGHDEDGVVKYVLARLYRLWQRLGDIFSNVFVATGFLLIG